MDSYDTKIGDKIRVRIKGTTRGSIISDDPSMYSTTTIGETSGGQWTHYVYLGSSSTSTADDGSVDVEFDAEITGEPRQNQSITTQVKELSPSGEASGCIHFIYLGSDCVTKLTQRSDGVYRTDTEQISIVRAAKDAQQAADELNPPKQPRVPVDGINGRKGAKIRVKFSGMPTGPRETQINGTTIVQEIDGEKSTHLLYLSSGGSTGATVTADNRVVSVEFDAEITGEYGGREFGTTEVKQLLSGDSRGYTHYVFLGSSSVSLLPEDPAEVQAATEKTISVPEAEAALLAAIKTPETDSSPVEKGFTVSIDRYDEEINYRMVQSRIEDLESDTETTYAVTRERNGEVLETFGDADDARDYIDDNDYNPERVVVRESDPDQEDVDELEMLQVLDSDCATEFGREWNDGEVTLYREDYFDADWARGEAADTLGVQLDDLDNWPLNLIDWSNAAGDRLENNYTQIEFDGATYYGRNV